MRQHIGLRINKVVAFVITLSLALLLSFLQHALAQNSGASTQYALIHQGQKRTYLVYVPSSLDTRRAAPVVFLFHGGGGSGSGAERMYEMDRMADRYGFIVVYPDGLNRHWADGRSGANPGVDDIGFVSGIVDAMSLRNSIDKDALFACGISNGALFSHYLAQVSSPKIRAIASVAGALCLENLGIRPRQSVDVLLIHGTNDRRVPISGGQVNSDIGGAILSQNATMARWQEYNGGSLGSAVGREISSNSGSNLGYRHSPINTPASVTTQRTRSGAVCTSVRIESGGHTWPSHPSPLMGLDGLTAMNFDATEMIARFFNDSLARR